MRTDIFVRETLGKYFKCSNKSQRQILHFFITKIIKNMGFFHNFKTLKSSFVKNRLIERIFKPKKIQYSTEIPNS